MRSRVFLVEQPRRRDLDISGLAEFGETTCLFGPSDRRSSIFEARAFCDDVAQQSRRVAFDPANDYYALSGGLAVTCLGLAALLEEYGKIRVLMYDAMRSTYVSKEIGHDREVQAPNETASRAV